MTLTEAQSYSVRARAFLRKARARVQAPDISAMPTIHYQAITRRPTFDTEPDRRTVVLPAIERYDVRPPRTYSLVKEAVERFYSEHERYPEVVLLSPLRLLTVPGHWWGRYQVALEEHALFVALSALEDLDDDTAKGLSWNESGVTCDL